MSSISLINSLSQVIGTRVKQTLDLHYSNSREKENLSQQEYLPIFSSKQLLKVERDVTMKLIHILPLFQTYLLFIYNQQKLPLLIQHLVGRCTFNPSFLSKERRDLIFDPTSLFTFSLSYLYYGASKSNSLDPLWARSMLKTPLRKIVPSFFPSEKDIFNLVVQVIKEIEASGSETNQRV